MKNFCLTTLIFCLIISSFNIYSCTDIFISNKYSNVSARTMDLDEELKPEIILVKRNINWKTEENNNNAIEWQNKYSFIAVSTLGEKTIFCDGINEKGLSAANLYLKETIYPTPAETEKTIPVMNLASWILGNFRNVAEVQKALNNIVVTGNIYKPWGVICSLHFVVHDSTGSSLVIEWIDGAIKLHESHDGISVLTNSPQYEEQLKNLKSDNLKNRDITTSPDRFQFAFKLLKDYFAAMPECKDFVPTIGRIIGRLTVIEGEDKVSHNIYSYTRFSIIRDHTNKKYYIRYRSDLNYLQYKFVNDSFLPNKAKLQSF